MDQQEVTPSSGRSSTAINKRRCARKATESAHELLDAIDW